VVDADATVLRLPREMGHLDQQGQRGELQSKPPVGWEGHAANFATLHTASGAICDVMLGWRAGLRFAATGADRPAALAVMAVMAVTAVTAVTAAYRD